MGDVRPVIAVTGLRREGALVEGQGVVVVSGGGDVAGLHSELARLAQNAAGIISFGMAGALDPALRIGDLVIGERVTGAVEATCDVRWLAALAARLPNARTGAVHADGRLISGVAEKTALFVAGAIAADMESHVAAQIAAAAGLPLAVLRCISDEARAELPPAIAVAMKPGGGLALGAVIGSILAHPGQAPRLCRTVAGFSRGFAALRQGAAAISPRLAFPG